MSIRSGGSEEDVEGGDKSAIMLTALMRDYGWKCEGCKDNREER